MNDLSPDIQAAQFHLREASRTKPLCPVHAARAIQHYENAKAEIDRRITQIKRDMR